MQSDRLVYINFYDSVADLRDGKVTRVPIREAEERIAEHREIGAFSWLENFKPSDIFGTDPQSISTKLIDPDKLAVCYFGHDIGFATVAAGSIMEGESLVFAGDIVTDLSTIDPRNPYLSGIPGIHPVIVDAKYKGGFASMFMDLPDQDTIGELNRKSISGAQAIAVTNFDCDLYQETGKISLLALRANRDIAPGEILGHNYIDTARLLYRKFVGFNKNGARLTESLNWALNKKIYKKLRYRNLNQSEIILHKVTRNIARERFQKALLDLDGKAVVIRELYNQELSALILFLQSQTLSADSCMVPYINNLLQNILRECFDRLHEQRLFLRRELARQIIESNDKQLQYKGRCRMDLVNCSEYYVLYPGIEDDFVKIGKCHGSLGNLSAAVFFMRHSILFARKKETRETEEISGALLRLKLDSP